MTDHGWPWIMDNGAYSGGFDPAQWRDGLQTARNMGNAPDFVVLPDAFKDWIHTRQRHERFASWVPDEWDTATVAQPCGTIDGIITTAQRLDSSTLFIGGGHKHQRQRARELIEAAHSAGLDAHIGGPAGGLSWARDLGADSVDTTSIVRNQSWERLRAFEATEPTDEVTLTEYAD